MKKIILFLSILSFGFTKAQVAFGKTSVDGSAVLDFAENLHKGIILPWVEDLTKVSHSPGTLLYSSTDKKVLWFDGASWQDLSVNTGNVDTSEILNLPENEIITKSAVIIGDVETAPIGVLSLNKQRKALVLPKDDLPWQNIKKPEAGTIVYDTTNNLICVFNGTEWTFWGK